MEPDQTITWFSLIMLLPLLQLGSALVWGGMQLTEMNKDAGKHHDVHSDYVFPRASGMTASAHSAAL